jgi:hypothetical protein
MYKYGFLTSNQGQIVGGGGIGFPKPGVHLNALGVLPMSPNDRQYFKGFYNAGISKDIKNLNLGLGVNTSITGYPGENGFVRNPIKMQPNINLKYNFANGGMITDCEPGFIKDENGNCIPDYGCKGDTPCRETDQIQSYYNEAMDIPRQIVDYGEQVAFDYNENNIDPRTYWKKAVNVSQSGFPDPSCMGAAGALPRCVPTIKNYMKQFPRAHDFSNYKFTKATKNNQTAYNTVGTYRDPKFDEESKGNVKPGDIVNFMGGDHSPHAMTFAGWNNGKAEYLASNGYPGDFGRDASNVGSMNSPGRKAYVQRFNQKQYVNTVYGEKIKELEEKARNNPSSSGPLYLQPLKPQFINQVINTKP